MLQQWVPRIPPGKVEEGEEEGKVLRRQMSNRMRLRARRSPARRCRYRRPLSSNSSRNSTRRRRPWVAATSSWCFLSLIPHNTRIWSWIASLRVSDEVSRCTLERKLNFNYSVALSEKKKSMREYDARNSFISSARNRYELYACTVIRSRDTLSIQHALKYAYDYSRYA